MGGAEGQVGEGRREAGILSFTRHMGWLGGRRDIYATYMAHGIQKSQHTAFSICHGARYAACYALFLLRVGEKGW